MAQLSNLLITSTEKHNLSIAQSLTPDRQGSLTAKEAFAYIAQLITRGERSLVPMVLDECS